MSGTALQLLAKRAEECTSQGTYTARRKALQRQMWCEGMQAESTTREPGVRTIFSKSRRAQKKLIPIVDAECVQRVGNFRRADARRHSAGT